MKQFSFIVFLLSILISIPAYSSDKFVIDFRDRKAVFSDNPIDLIELFERRKTGYRGQRVTDVIVFADPRRRNYGGYVQLLDRYRRIISEGSLSSGYVSLQVYEDYQRAAYLRFEDDVYLKRIEILTERQRHRKPLEQKRGVKRKNVIEIGSFVKRNYKPEVKKFSFHRGGFSTINFKVNIGEQQAVIVNTIRVFSNGRKLGMETIGRRLSNGDNKFSLNVPEDATDILVSFDHGQGSSVKVILLR